MTMTLKQILNNYTYDQLKEMYRADRKLVQDRLYKMGKTEFKNSKTYKEYYNKLPKLRNLKTKEELAAAFYDTDRLIRSGFTSISKQREQKAKVLAGLEHHDYDFINESNYWEFYEFMQWFEDNKLKPIYGSPTDEELITYLDAVRTRSDPEEMKKIFLEYKEHDYYDTLEDFLRDYYS
jgi:hypothetical protein